MTKSKRNKPKKRGAGPDKPRQSRLPSQMSVDAIVKRFTVCGRCSFFVAGYKLLVGDEEWETAVNQIDGRWLPLTWNADVRNLVSHSFGARLNVDYFHYESRCPECGRSFQYRAADDKSPEQPLFQIEL
jgi:hypothetical protein